MQIKKLLKGKTHVKQMHWIMFILHVLVDHRFWPVANPWVFANSQGLKAAHGRWLTDDCSRKTLIGSKIRVRLRPNSFKSTTPYKTLWPLDIKTSVFTAPCAWRWSVPPGARVAGRPVARHPRRFARRDLGFANRTERSDRYARWRPLETGSY